MNNWMNEWMNEWMNGSMNEWVNGWMNECMYVCMCGCVIVQLWAVGSRRLWLLQLNFGTLRSGSVGLCPLSSLGIAGLGLRQWKTEGEGRVSEKQPLPGSCRAARRWRGVWDFSSRRREGVFWVVGSGIFSWHGTRLRVLGFTGLWCRDYLEFRV